MAATVSARAALLLSILLASAGPGCVDTCTFLGETPALYEASYRRAVPEAAFRDAFNGTGWTYVENATAGERFGSPTHARPVNDTVTLYARWGILAPEDSAGGTGYSSLLVWAHNTSFSEDDAARMFLEPHLRATLDDLDARAGAPDRETWRGGDRHCGSV